MVCTFFGHRECPELKEKICGVLEELITGYQVDTFFVGNNGHFDRQVRGVLMELSRKYPHIRYAVVLSGMPGSKGNGDDGNDTILPEGIERIHPKFAIDWRNRWMLERADYVVTYICRSWGGAGKFAALAGKRKKHIINIEA